MGADLDDSAAQEDSVAKNAARHRACSYPRGSLARTGAATAAIVSDAIFLIVGIVGMTGAVPITDLTIIFRPLICIFDHQRDRCACGDRAAGPVILKDAGQDFHLIGFPTLGYESRGAGAALVEELLNEGLIQRKIRRAAIDHASECGPVAFAPGGHAEEVAERVVRHGCPFQY